MTDLDIVMGINIDVDIVMYIYRHKYILILSNYVLYFLFLINKEGLFLFYSQKPIPYPLMSTRQSITICCVKV